MEIMAKDIQLCAKCNNYRGKVEEKYNGQVEVHCICTLRQERIKYGHWRSPCMMSPNGDKFWWTPASGYYGSDGQWWLKLYSNCPPLN